MAGRQWIVSIIVALIASGIWPFLTAVLKRKPEVRQADAQTTSITVQGAETTVTVLMKTLEHTEARAERLEAKLADREAALEAKLAEREAKIDELEKRLEHMSAKLHAVQDELNDALAELAALRNGQ
jgi:uncharacterized protein YhaN